MKFDFASVEHNSIASDAGSETGIYWKSMSGKFLGCNHQMAKMMGLETEGSISGKSDAEFWDGPIEMIDGWTTTDKLALTEGWCDTSHERTVAGQKKTFSVLKRRLIGSSGEVIGVVGYCTDRNKPRPKLGHDGPERRKPLLESVAVQFALDRERNDFIDVARRFVHDVSTPLAALSMVIPRLENVPPELQGILSTALSRLMEQCKDMRAYYVMKEAVGNAARANNMQTEAPVEHNLVWLAPQVLATHTSKSATLPDADIDFMQSIDDKARFAFIAGDACELQPILNNMIDNAVSALDGEPGKIHLDLKSDDGRIVLRVNDTGIGMPNFIKSRILQGVACTDRDSGGRGRSLVSLSRFMKRYEGKFDIDSTPNNGARFTLAFKQLDAPKWAQTSLKLDPEHTIMVLDAEESIHQKWKVLLDDLLVDHPKMRLMHFKELIDMCEVLVALSSPAMLRTQVLTDHRLLRDDENWTSLLSGDKPFKVTILDNDITQPDLIEYALDCNFKVLPKQLVPYLPVSLR